MTKLRLKTPFEQLSVPVQDELMSYLDKMSDKDSLIRSYLDKLSPKELLEVIENTKIHHSATGDAPYTDRLGVWA